MLSQHAESAAQTDADALEGLRIVILYRSQRVAENIVWLLEALLGKQERVQDIKAV